MARIRDEAVNKHGCYIGPTQATEPPEGKAIGAEAIDDFFSNLNGDDVVDFLDLLTHVDAWLAKDTSSPDGAE